MKITFGCIVIYNNKILLVRERSEKSKQLERWNLLSGSVKSKELVFKKAVKREVKEETGLNVELVGIVGVYESITPKDTTLYFVFGCKVIPPVGSITTTDPEVIKAQWFELEKFFSMKESLLVHSDMKLVTKNFQKGKYISLIKTVEYD